MYKIESSTQGESVKGIHRNNRVMRQFIRNDETDDDQERANEGHKGLSVWIGSAFIVAQLAGVGVLNLPQAVAHIGLSGVIVLILVTALVGYVSIRFSLCWIMLEEQVPDYKGNFHPRPYQAIAKEAFGKGISYITEFLMVVSLFGASSVQLLIMGEILRSRLSTIYSNLSICPLIIYIGGFLTPFTFFRSPKNFWQTSIGATLTIILVISIVTISATLDHPSYTPTYPSPTFSTFVKGLGSILYSFGGIPTFPNIQNDMENKALFPKSIKIAFSCLAVFYVVVGVTNFYTYGAQVQSNILFTMSGASLTASEILLFIHLFLSFLIVINPVMKTIDHLITLLIGSDFIVYRLITRTVVMMVVVLATEAMPRFESSLNFLGGLSVSLLTLILPTMCYMILANRKTESGSPYRVLSFTEVLVLLLALAIGVFSLFATVINSAVDFAGKEAFEQACI